MTPTAKGEGLGLKRADSPTFKQGHEPGVYEQTGGLFKFLQEKLETFLSNPVCENIILANIIVFICSQPVRVDLLDD